MVALVSASTVPIGASPASASPIVPFTSVFHTQDNGAVAVFGNTLLTCPTITPGCTQAQLGQGPNLNNNNWSMAFLDADADPSTFDSSSSTVALPQGSTVLFAGLYWGARRTAGANGAAATSNVALLQLMSLQTPTTGYQTISASSFYDGTGFDAGRGYQSFADVTSLVQAGGSGTYWGANVQSATGQDRYAGWSLIVAYRNPALPLRDLTVFNGFSYVQPGPADSISLSGFLAPPFGAVRAQLGVVAYEGDLGTTGDSMTLNGTKLTDALNPATNFFNADDTNLGFPVTTRNPNFPNLMGFDLKTVDVSKIIPNGATSATIGLSTTGDVYFPGAVTSQIDLYAPDFPPITKSVTDLQGHDPAQVGDTLQYTLNYPNNGGDAAVGVVAQDPLPANVTYVAGSLMVASGANAGPKSDVTGDDQAELNGGTRTVTFRLGSGANGSVGGTLNPGDATSVTFKATIDPAASGTALANTATLNYTAKTINKAFVYPGNTTNTPVAAIADLSVTKSASPSPAVPGAGIVYTLNVANAGPAAADNVVLTDPLSSELTVVSVTSTAGSCTVAGAVSCSLGTLANGGTAAVTVNATVSPTALVPLVNTATVDSTTPDPNDANNSASTVTDLAPSADLSIIKSVSPTTPTPGGPATFTLTVNNAGPSAAQGVVVTDPIQSGLTIGSVTTGLGTCAVQPDQVQCQLGTLGPASGTTITISTTLASLFPANTLSNSAVVSSDTADPDAAANEANVSESSAPVADLAITKTASAPTVSVGGALTYTLTVSDGGPSAATDTVVTDPLPDSFILSSVTSTQGTCTQSPPVVCDLGTVTTATTVTVTIVGTIDLSAPPGVMTNVATVSAPAQDPVPGNNTAEAPVTVTASTAIDTTETAATGTATAGGDVSYTIDIANNGAVPADDVVLTDPLPDGLTGATFTTSAGTCTVDGSTLSCDLGTIPAGATDVITIDGVLPPSDPSDAVVDTVVVESATTLTGTTSGSTILPLAHVSGLSITKTVDNPTPMVGSTVTYTVTLTAAGPSTAFAPTVSDVLPPGLTFMSASATSGLYDQDNGIWTVGDLAPGAGAILTIVAGVDGAGTVVNIASVLTSQESDPSLATTASASISTAAIVVATPGPAPGPSPGPVPVAAAPVASVSPVVGLSVPVTG